MAYVYEFKYVTMEGIKEASHLLADSFIKLNGIYQKQQSTYDEIYPVFYYELEHSIRHNLTFGLYLKGKMIGVGINHDMSYYPKMDNKAWLEATTSTVSYERRYVQTIEEQLLKTNYKPGIAIYGIYGCVAPEHASRGAIFQLFGLGMNQMKKMGYKTFFATACAEKALQIFLGLGGKILKEMKCEDPGMQGERYTFLTIDFTKSIPVKRVTQKKEIKPKL